MYFPLFALQNLTLMSCEVLHIQIFSDAELAYASIYSLTLIEGPC